MERVSVLDASNLRVEKYGLPMHMAALVILDAGPLLDPSGALRLVAVGAHIEERTRSARRLRQVLAFPRRGRPVWVGSADLDITHHVRARALPPPADEATLLAACAELNEVPLDRSRPLWEIWLLTGMAGNRIGMLIRLHHVVADGMAALAMLAPLFELAETGSPASLPEEDERNIGTREGAEESVAPHPPKPFTSVGTLSATTADQHHRAARDAHQFLGNRSEANAPGLLTVMTAQHQQCSPFQCPFQLRDDLTTSVSEVDPEAWVSTLDPSDRVD